MNEETHLLLYRTSGVNMGGVSSSVAQQRDRSQGQGNEQISLFNTGGGKHISRNDAMQTNGHEKAFADILMVSTDAADKLNKINDEKSLVGPPFLILSN